MNVRAVELKPLFWKPRLDAFGLTALVVLLAAFVSASYFPGIEYDPDRFYHFAVSRIYAAGGFPATLPQAEDIGWGQAFAEKEYLFHVLSGFAWRLGGESGVIVFYRILFALLVTSLGYTLARAAKKPWLLPVASAVIVVCCAQFASRMNMLRPHVFAILLMTWQLMAWRSQRWKLAAILGALYVLAYHAFYIPLTISGIFIVCWWLAGRDVSRPLAWTILSIAAGIVVNPAFPQNIATGVMVLQIATQRTEAIPEYFFGQELHLLNSTQLLIHHGFVLFLPLALIFLFARNRTLDLRGLLGARDLREPEIVATLVTATAFSGLMFLTPRAFEIAVPAGIIAVATLAGRRESTGFRLVTVFLVAFAMFHIKGSVDRIQAAARLNKGVPAASESIRSALSVIPENQSLKVFNWSWWVSPFILYHRPDLKFIDLLDPTFLQKKSPEMSRLRLAVFEDRESDPWYVVRNVFHADYVMIPPSITGRWTTDPHFSLVKNMDAATDAGRDAVADQYAFSTFKVAKDRIGRFVSRGRTGTGVVNLPFEKVLEGTIHREDIALQGGYPKIESKDTPEAPELVFIDTFKSYASGQNDGKTKSTEIDPLRQSLCTRVLVDPAEIQRVVMAAGRVDYLGIGGGSWTGAWVNGRGVYQAENPFAPKLVDMLIDLRSLDMASIQSIEAVACTKPTSNRAGLAISLWSHADLTSHCGQIRDARQNREWLMTGNEHRECLGAPILAKSP